MKKLSTILLALVLLFAFSTTALATNADQSQTLTYRQIGIVIDGQELIPTDANGKAVEPFIMQDTTYLPLRAVANALGLSVHWEAKTHTVTLDSGATPYFGTGTPLATKASKKATLSYRDIRIVLDGKTLVPLSADGRSAEPFIIDGVTYLPLRAFAEALGVNVHWVGSRNLILLTSPDYSSIDEPIETPDYLCFTARADGSTVKMKKYGSPDAIDLVYSKDKQTWLPFVTAGAPVNEAITLAKGEKVYIKAKTTNATFSTSNQKHYYFVLKGSFSVSGNVMSLVDESCTRTDVTSYMFTRLFQDCAALINAYPLLLPATTLAENCYAYMFYYCTALTAAPELPATTLAEYCYSGMFKGCTALYSAPNLPATTLAECCYSGMFNDCTNLKSINVSFTQWPSTAYTGPDYYATDHWMYGVASAGIFICPTALPHENPANVGISAIPSGWGVRTK